MGKVPFLLLAAMLLLVGLPHRAAASSPVVDPVPLVGDWIWGERVEDGQECRFVRAFTIPDKPAVASARLRITADNAYQVYLDGDLIGQGSDWRVLTEYDLRLLLEPGEHVLAVSALNDFDVAGMVAILRVEFADGQLMEIPSDARWLVAPNSAYRWQHRSRAWKHWPPAKVIEPLLISQHPMIYRAPPSRPVRHSLWDRPWFQFTVSTAALAGLVAGLFLASRLYFKSRVERVVNRERARIAADLHDDLGGGLTQLVLIGEAAMPAVAEDSPAAAALDRLRTQARGLLRGMNEAVWLINSQRDTFRDVASYIAKHAETFFQDTPVRCLFDVENDIPALPCDLGIRRNVFLAVKEALHNVLRHSGATTVELAVHLDRNHLVIVISDNGRGFDPEHPAHLGNGLRNLRVRAEEAGGTCAIHSAPGNGCRIEFRLPMQPPSRSWIFRLFRRPPRGTPCR